MDNRDDYGRNDVTAKLGCGTLILIGLVAAFFGGAGLTDLESDVSGLRSTVDELQQTIDRQTSEIQTLRERVDSLLVLQSG